MIILLYLKINLCTGSYTTFTLIRIRLGSNTTQKYLITNTNTVQKQQIQIQIQILFAASYFKYNYKYCICISITITNTFCSSIAMLTFSFEISIHILWYLKLAKNNRYRLTSSHVKKNSQSHSMMQFWH